MSKPGLQLDLSDVEPALAFTVSVLGSCRLSKPEARNSPTWA